MDDYLTCRGVCKTYDGRIRALQDVELTVGRGRVHAIIGENGAGKSTLAKILGGLIRADSEKILFQGRDYAPNSPREADALGIGMVHQHFMLFPSLTVAENVMLGHEPVARGQVDLARAAAEIEKLARRFGLEIDPKERVRNLSVGQRQRVEILKALYRKVELLILDEPTAVLTPQEVDKLFAGINKLIAEGYTVIIIAHKLEEVLAIADDITVLRRGRKIGTRRRNGTSKEELIRMMIGGSDHLAKMRKHGTPGDEILVITDLSVMGPRGRALLSSVSLTARAGEIVGIAGIEGNGQDALEKVLAGLVPATSGSIFLAGEEVSRRSPRERRRLGLSLVPSDRLAWGCAARASVFENAIVHHYRTEQRRGLLKRRSLHERVTRLLKRFDVRVPGTEVPMSSLSGGNIQKLILGRELSCEHDLDAGRETAGAGGAPDIPRALVAAKPTRGLDVGGVAFIHDLLRSYRDAGCAILLISTDLDEILALSDRIGVLYQGSLVALLSGRSQTGKEELGRYMLGGRHGHERLPLGKGRRR